MKVANPIANVVEQAVPAGDGGMSANVLKNALLRALIVMLHEYWWLRSRPPGRSTQSFASG